MTGRAFQLVSATKLRQCRARRVQRIGFGLAIADQGQKGRVYQASA